MILLEAAAVLAFTGGFVLVFVVTEVLGGGLRSEFAILVLRLIASVAAGLFAGGRTLWFFGPKLWRADESRL